MKVLRGEKSLLTAISTAASIARIKFESFMKPLVNRVLRQMGNTNVEDLPYDLKMIAGRNIRVKFIFADNDPGIQLLMDGAGMTVKELVKRGIIGIETIPKANHNFSSHRGRTQLLAKITEHFSKNYE